MIARVSRGFKVIDLYGVLPVWSASVPPGDLAAVRPRLPAVAHPSRPPLCSYYVYASPGQDRCLRDIPPRNTPHTASATPILTAAPPIPTVIKAFVHQLPACRAPNVLVNKRMGAGKAPRNMARGRIGRRRAAPERVAGRGAGGRWARNTESGWRAAGRGARGGECGAGSAGGGVRRRGLQRRAKIATCLVAEGDAAREIRPRSDHGDGGRRSHR